jgi:monoamine oxidase
MQSGVRHEFALDRRKLLQGIGAASALTAASVAIPQPAAAGPSSTAGDGRDGYDVIVIGAGFAGVTAARELRANGLRTVVLEARNRIGGRTWTENFAGGQMELGGQWISDRQQLVVNELNRYGIPLVPDASPDVAVFPTPEGLQRFDPDEPYGRIAELVERLFTGSRKYFPRPLEPLHRADLLSRIDHLSLRDGVDRLRLAPRDRMWLDLTVSGYAGGSGEQGALTALAQWWALSGWDIDGWFGIMAHRPAGGMVRLLRAILADQPVDVRLRQEVTAVVDMGGSVLVRTRTGRTYRAPHVVVAVPVNVWRDILFAPRLPSVFHAATTEGVGVAETVKLWLHVRGYSETIIAEGPPGVPISSLIPAGRAPGGGHLLVGFGFDPSLDITRHSAVEAAVRRLIPEARLLGYRAHSWGRDPFARGAQALRRPGQLLRQLPAIQQPHGRMVFAGADIASGWVGFVDGAIESGRRAAGQILSMARGSDRQLAR